MFPLAVAVLVVAPPDPAVLVKQLASPRFVDREKAAQKLWELGTYAHPAVAAAGRSENAEVRQRAMTLLDKFDWGIFPDTPADVVAVIRTFRGGDLEAQQTALTTLLRRTPPPVETLRTLLTRDFPDDRRLDLFQFLTRRIQTEVPRLLVAGDGDRAESLAALSFVGPDPFGHADAAALFHLRGKTPQLVARLKAMTTDSAQIGRTFAQRFAGNPAAAHTAAANVGGPLLDSLLEDQHAWTELDARPVREEEAQSVAGLSLFHARKTGNAAAVAKWTADMRKAELDYGLNDGPVFEAAVGLLLNGDSSAAVELLREKRAQPHLLADVMAARLELREALDLIGQGATAKAADADADPRVRTYYAVRRARLLAQLGRTDDAVQQFHKVAADLRNNDQYAIQQLIRAEVRAGRVELAAEHAALFLYRFDTTESGFYAKPGPFEMLFEDDSAAAAWWWKILRRFGPKDEKPGFTMTRIRELLAGTATPDRFQTAFDALLKARDKARPEVDGPPTPPHVLAGWATAAAAAYRAAGKYTEAEKEYVVAAEHARSEGELEPDDPSPRLWVYGTDERFRPWLDLGDFLADRGRYADAAAKYYQGWERFPDNPLLLYLSGWALTKCGKDGAKRVELSHIVPLGNARMRSRFLEELIARGHLTAARRERDLVRQTAWNREVYRGNVWNTLAKANSVLKDWTASAEAADRSLYYILRTPGVTFVEGTAYVTVPTGVRVQTARARIAEGRFDEGMTIARECLSVVRATPEVVVSLVADLDAAKQSKRADELFREAWAASGKVAAEYPDSGWARHMAAAVAVGCRRELKAGLDHAKAAVEREPAVKLYRETLAEAHFRNGDRESAIKVMRELARQDWRSGFYRRQLVRYATGDVGSPLPTGVE